uniref:Secreted phosphoprotein 1 n=1 Tax=Maylandia zebra TaxID=106582 RepID=A0A3P9CB42_9CICH
MKVAVVFVLLFATVLCRERMRHPWSLRKQAPVVLKARPPPVQVKYSFFVSIYHFQVAAEALPEVKSVVTDTTSDSPSVNNQDNEDGDDDDEAEESEEEEEDESSDSSESGESSTPAPSTVAPVVVTETPAPESTDEPIVATVVTDTARGDNLGGYPSEYKSIVYVEEKSYHKAPGPYKSYEFEDTGKKTAYSMTGGNEVEKLPKVYKTIYVNSELLEEDTSTPEVESQGLDASSGTSQDPDPRQADLAEEEESTSTSDPTTSESESSSTPEEEEEEEEEESASTTSDSTSQEAEDEESQSSEEATATPGAADADSDESDSTESDSDEEGAAPDTTTDIPAVITAK